MKSCNFFVIFLGLLSCIVASASHELLLVKMTYPMDPYRKYKSIRCQIFRDQVEISYAVGRGNGTVIQQVRPSTVTGNIVDKIAAAASRNVIILGQPDQIGDLSAYSAADNTNPNHINYFVLREVQSGKLLKDNPAPETEDLVNLLDLVCN